MAASLEELRAVLERVEAQFPCTAMGTVLRAQYQQLANEHSDSAQHAQHVSAFQATAQRILSSTRAHPHQRRGPHRRALPPSPPQSPPPPNKTFAAAADSAGSGAVWRKETAGCEQAGKSSGEKRPSAPRTCRSASLYTVAVAGTDGGGGEGSPAETSAVTAARKALSLNSVADLAEMERQPKHDDDEDGDDDDDPEAAAAAAAAATAAIETETEAEDKEEALARKRPQCVVCLDGEPAHAFVPCGHVVLCSGCAAQYPVALGCPVCRAEATALIKVYFQ